MAKYLELNPPCVCGIPAAQMDILEPSWPLRIHKLLADFILPTFVATSSPLYALTKMKQFVSYLSSEHLFNPLGSSLLTGTDRLKWRHGFVDFFFFYIFHIVRQKTLRHTCLLGRAITRFLSWTALAVFFWLLYKSTSRVYLLTPSIHTQWEKRGDILVLYSTFWGTFTLVSVYNLSLRRQMTCVILLPPVNKVEWGSSSMCPTCYLLYGVSKVKYAFLFKLIVSSNSVTWRGSLQLWVSISWL